MALAGSAAQDVQAAQPRGGSQGCFSCVCLAANASLLPEHGEKAARPEEWTESARFLQGQEEEEERLRDAGQAGTASISQDTEVQVSWKGWCCWRQQLAWSMSPAWSSLVHAGLGSPIFGRRTDLRKGEEAQSSEALHPLH